MAYTYNPNTQKAFKANLGYIVSLRSAWAIQVYPISKKGVGEKVQLWASFVFLLEFFNIMTIPFNLRK